MLVPATPNEQLIHIPSLSSIHKQLLRNKKPQSSPQKGKENNSKVLSIPQLDQHQYPTVQTDSHQRHIHGPGQRYTKYAIAPQQLFSLEYPTMNSHKLALTDHVCSHGHTGPKKEEEINHSVYAIQFTQLKVLAKRENLPVHKVPSQK